MYIYIYLAIKNEMLKLLILLFWWGYDNHTIEARQCYLWVRNLKRLITLRVLSKICNKKFICKIFPRQADVRILLDDGGNTKGQKSEGVEKKFKVLYLNNTLT